MALFHGKFSAGVAAVTFIVSLSLIGTAAQAQAPEKPPVTPHDVEGRSQCLMCHSGAMEAIKAVPENHAGRANETCGWCHATDAEIQTKAPKTIPHDLEGRGQCLMCHSGAMEAIKAAPASHAGRANETCGWCHTKAAG